MADPADLVALLQRLASGTPLPRAALDAALGDPGDADALRMLRDHGVQLDAAQAVIPGGLDVLHADAIEAALARRGQPARALEVVWSIDSTNSAMLAHARTGDIDRCVLLAEHQSAGRGRRGRTWMSPVACNLYLSIGATFAKMEDAQALSLCTGVALADALGDLGYHGIGIKWPNDLQVDGRKLSGILIESGGPVPAGSGSGSGSGRPGAVAMVIGIGVNVRVPDYVGEQIDQPWTDLGRIAPRAARRDAIASAIIGQVFAMLESLHRGERAAWLERFAACDIARDAAVTLRLPDRELHGIARGIDPGGELRVEVDGVLRTFSAGEVSLRVR
jgi:BirA family biotin operon repressor/biotin-[acetyl-CoA-carboxylase] ligase